MAALWSPRAEPAHFHLWANGTSSGGYGKLRRVTLSHCGGGEEMMESESMSDWTDAHPQKPWTKCLDVKHSHRTLHVLSFSCVFVTECGIKRLFLLKQIPIAATPYTHTHTTHTHIHTYTRTHTHTFLETTPLLSITAAWHKKMMRKKVGELSLCVCVCVCPCTHSLACLSYERKPKFFHFKPLFLI